MHIGLMSDLHEFLRLGPYRPSSALPMTFHHRSYPKLLQQQSTFTCKRSCPPPRVSQECMTCPSASTDGVAMLLDLDNFPLHSRRSGLLTAIRLKSIAEAWAGPVTDFAAFCNVDTAKKSAWLQSAMEIAGIGLAVADVRGNAADRLMKSHAANVAQQCKSIVIVSADAGFAETARHCRSAACQVLVIGVIGRWEATQPWRWSRAKLAAAADVAMRWSNTQVSGPSSGELHQLSVLSAEARRRCDSKALAAIDRAMGGGSQAGTVVDTWRRLS